MKRKINQAQPEGRAQPEIRPGDKWRDNHGSEITISAVSASLVIYYREGYSKTFVCSSGRLRREFVFVRTDVKPSKGLDCVMQATGCAERIRVMREIIRERGKANEKSA